MNDWKQTTCAPWEWVQGHFRPASLITENLSQAIAERDQHIKELQALLQDQKTLTQKAREERDDLQSRLDAIVDMATGE